MVPREKMIGLRATLRGAWMARGGVAESPPVGLAAGLACVGVKMIVGMTRLIDAVERLTGASERTAGTVEDHERRLLVLEHR